MAKGFREFTARCSLALLLRGACCIFSSNLSCCRQSRRSRKAAHPTQPRTTRQYPGHLGHQGARGGLEDSGCDLRHHPGRHSAFRRDQHSRKRCAWRPGVEVARINSRHLVDWHSRIRQPPVALRAGADRRTQRLLAAARRGVLGSAGHADRRHRSHRGHPRARAELSGDQTPSTA